MEFFRKDARVSHAELGTGIVIAADRYYTTIAFDDGAVRKFVTRLVRLERSTQPGLPASPPGEARRRQPPVKAQKATS